MVAIREGMNGAAVRRAQSLLNANRGARRPLAADGRFGRLTREAVMAFQQSKGLTADGIIGAETWRALESQPLTSVVDKYPVGPQEMLADVAALYVGTTETLDNRMGNDARLREIFEADDLVNKDGTTDGYAWCCAFVSVCTQRLFAMSPMFPTVSAPRVASVHLFRTRWAPEQGC
jgi:peptidoglycan hydrolase-like protein with peptidoglycan-binding domain